MLWLSARALPTPKGAQRSPCRQFGYRIVCTWFLLFASVRPGGFELPPSPRPRGWRSARGWVTSLLVSCVYLFCWCHVAWVIVRLLFIVTWSLCAFASPSAAPAIAGGAAGAAGALQQGAAIRVFGVPARLRFGASGHGAIAPLAWSARHIGVRFAGFFVSMRHVLRHQKNRGFPMVR